MPMNISLFFQEDHGAAHNFILTTGIDWMMNEMPWWIEGNLNPLSPSSFCTELITSDWLSKTSNCWYYYLFCLWNSRQIDKLRKSQKNVYFSKPGDSREMGNLWNAYFMQGSGPFYCSFMVFLFLFVSNCFQLLF